MFNILDGTRDVVQNVSHLAIRKVEDQGGIISGQNPAAFNPADPIRLWIIQVGIIIIFTYLLSLGLSKLRQPRVIAEIIGGVILGPTAMGRIPGFTENIFPPASLPYLNLTATIALVLFLFLVGLETDVRVLKKNARASAAISTVGVLLPFGLGAAAAVPLYNEFVDTSKASFGHFLLFVGVAISITAFPVLCRILSELELLETTVGSVVLAAGVGNDVAGWILLALTVALVNAGSGLTALYVLLVAIAWVVFLLIPVKRAFLWLARRDGSLDSGVPSPFMMTVTLLLVFISAFFTDVIGIHAIFGGFLAGLVIPHEGGFAIALVEKLEDLVTLLLLPIYFTISGLKTNLGLLDNGITWGYVVLIITVAFFGKFAGCFATARLCGFNLRESGAIGSLMSCKGLVELIVLNIGLQAQILDDRVFSMFVAMALALTIVTTPLTLLIYPASARVLKNSSAPWNTSETSDSSSGKETTRSSGELTRVYSAQDHKPSLTVVLNKFEHLPPIMTLVQLLQPSSTEGSVEKSLHPPRAPISIDALRLVELSDRTSAVMKGSGSEELVLTDALLNIFRTFGQLNRIPVSSFLSVVQHESFASTISAHAAQASTDLVIIPWSSICSAPEDTHANATGSGPAAQSYNPFDSLFGKAPPADKSVLYSHFVRSVFAESPADVALYVDRGVLGALASGHREHHLLMPFFGGPDDRAALSFVMQLCDNPSVSATVVRMSRSAVSAKVVTPAPTYDSVNRTTSFDFEQPLNGLYDTVYGSPTTETRLSSETADNIAWVNATQGISSSRVVFSELASPVPLHAAIRALDALSGKDVLVIAGRGRRMAVDSYNDELQEIVVEKGQTSGSVAETAKTIGAVATAFVVSTRIPLLVFQAADRFDRYR